MCRETTSGLKPQPGDGEEPEGEVKPFGIAKRVVWEAYRQVKANRGAAGIDGESIAMFEANLKLFESFLPAASKQATQKMQRTIRSWNLQRQTFASIGELAARYNPILRGWLNYYGHFCKHALLRVINRVEATLARWVRRKYKKLQRHEGRSSLWLWRVARRQPRLFSHWLVFGRAGGRTMGAV